MAVELWHTRPYALSEAMDRLFEQAFAPFVGTRLGNGNGTSFQSLPANVWETHEAYVAALLMPGVEEKSINVTVHEDTLTIEGEFGMQVPEGAKIIWQEFGPARFRRSLRLGAALDAAKVEAAYKNGLLLVTMPKAEHAKPRQIQVQVPKK